MSVPDPYQALELGRGADPRAIKTAYFRLVRLHPPEKDPEEFQRIRAAYELLSSPERKAAYDAEAARTSEVGDEAQAVLRAARECLGEEKFDAARDLLQALLEKNGDVHEARELLGFTFLHLGQAGSALAEFEKLAAQDPKSVEFRLHVAQTLRILEQLPEAIAAAQGALALEPGHVEASLLLGDLLGQAERWPESFIIWDAAIAKASSKVDALRLRLRFARAHLARRDQKAIEALFGQIGAELEQQHDPDLRRFVADRLAAMSAEMFSTDRGFAGSVLLEAAGRFSPAPVFEARLGPNARVLAGDLPEPSRAWLDAQESELKLPRVWRWTSGPALLALAVVFLLLYCWPIATATDHMPWEAGELLGIALLAFPAALLLAAGGLWLWRDRTQKGLGRKLLLHPLYLLDADGEALRAWPLVRLKSANVTQHHNNGSYSHTEVRLDFGKEQFRQNFAQKEVAEQWAQRALDARGRALQLLSRGLLGAEPGADLLPPALLAEGRKKTPLERARVKQRWSALAAGAVGAVLLCAIAPVIAARVADDAGASRALSGGLPQLRDYLRLFYKGRHHAEVNARIDALFADALHRAKKRAGGEVFKVERLLAALRKAPAVAVEVTLEDQLKGGAPGLAGLTKDGVVKRRRDLVEGRLRGALESLIGGEVKDASKPSAVFAVRYSLSPKAAVFEAPGEAPQPAVEAACTASLQVGDEVLASASATSSGEALYTAAKGALRSDPLLLQNEIILSTLDACGAGLFGSLAGVPKAWKPHASALLDAPPRSGSPYPGRP